MFRYTDDPIADAAAYDAELARLEDEVPRCDECNKPVMEDFCYELHDDRMICANCLEERFKIESQGHKYACDYCGHAITEDYAYENGDGEVFCEKCVVSHFKKDVIVG